MTYKANKKLPYDLWFDENPLKDTKYIEKAEYEKCDISIHKQMYDFATAAIKKLGGSSEWVKQSQE